MRDVAGMATTAFKFAGDKTRTVELRHLAARDVAVADQATTLIRRNADAFRRQADLLIAQGKEAADSTLGPRGGAWGYIDSKICDWIREQAKTPEGMVAVSEAYKTDKNVASIIYSSPHFLLGLSKDLHGRMLATAVEMHAPKAGARLREGQALADIVGNYESVVTSIHRSF